MTAEMTKGAQIRGALLKYRERNRYGKYPEELQLRAVEYSIQRRRAGATVARIAAELGVHDETAKAWSAESADGANSSSIKPIILGIVAGARGGAAGVVAGTLDPA